jgi:Icc protein
MRLVWSTDLHLNLASPEYITRFFDAVKALSADKLLITGDIAEGRSIDFYLPQLVEGLDGMPILFVLGNHDFYRSSIAEVREKVTALTEAYPSLTYVPAATRPIKLSNDWVLVGVDGWGDGRVGAPMSKRVVLNDWSLIADLWEADAVYNIPSRLALLQKLADADAAQLNKRLSKALEKHQNVMTVSHVAPFEGASWHEGQPSDRYFSPWFTWKVGGDVLLQAADYYRTRNILALCGHSHSPGVYQPRSNLQVKTGSAVYGCPEKSIVEVFEL